jgi:hypothetical protein
MATDTAHASKCIYFYLFWIGSRVFVGLLDMDPKFICRIRNLSSTSKKIKKNVDIYCFVASL